MKLVLRLLTVCALAWTCEAGVQAHDPQTLQTATNLFNWLKGLVGDGSSGTTHPNTEIKYNDNFVTKCPPNIIFVLDGSDSVSPIGFQHAKTALNREIRAVTEAFANADVGVILFSDVTEEIPLKTRSAKEIDDLIKQVDALKQPRRKTSIPTALRRARQNLLDYSVIEGRALNGDRSGNIIVLLSDGNPDNQRATIQEAKISKDREILIISLSLEDALLELLKDISHIVQEYRTAIDWVSLIACPSRILPDVPKASGCRDVLLVVDGSDSVLRRKEIVRQYLAYTALRYRKVTNAVGVNIYGSDPSIQASNTRLRLMENKYDLAESIRLKLMFPKTGGTGTDLAVLQSVGMLDDDIRNRPSTLVLITDGPPFDVIATREAIRSARYRGYPVIIIRVGTAMTDAVLSEISGGTQENVFSVNTFTDLFFVNFDSALCSNISGPCTVTTQSCSAPYIFDDRTCSCACPTTCPNGKTHDSSCSCQCIDICPVGQQQDSSCNCFCGNTCAQGTRQNYTNCLCERCPSACANGQFQDGNCACVCRNSCPTEEMLDANCNCVCRTTGLPSNRGVCDKVITQCSLTASSCRYPEVLNSTIFPCACVCPTQCPTATARSTGVCGQCVCLDTRSTYDPFTNRCEPRCSNTCPTGQQPDINNLCACQCINVCPRDQFADPSRGCSCQCVRTCPSGQVATPSSGCNCICDRTCNGGQIPNINQNCSCSLCDNACPQGQIPDPNRNCNCQCPNVCPRNQSPDVNNRCQCTCNNVCPAGQRPDIYNDCNCVCANQCPSGQFASTVNGCQCRCSNTCSNGQIASVANDCQCPRVCSNTCSFGQILNITNCQCQCDRTCPSGQSPNINNYCQCQCDRTCPTGQSPNINNYCQCQCDRTCPTGQSPNINNNCICECTNICSNGQLALVSNNCLCTSPNTCPFGQTPNINGQCQCERTCPFGQTPNINNNCQCQCDRTCPFGQTPNINNNCQCQCDRTCSFGQSANINNNCQCQCDRTCPFGQTPNINNCICECQNTCSNGQRASVTNNCVCSPAVCSNTCPTGRTPNINNNCICECTNICSNGQLALVSNNCLCTSPNTCPFGQTPNINGQCQCERTCPFGQSANINNNCQCQCDRTCSFGQSANINNNCQCQCDRTCSFGQSANINNNCQCQCDRTCPFGQTPNINNNCICECTNICSNGQLALVSNNCLCTSPNTCPFGQTPNINGQCQCERTCPFGQSTNINNNCQCQCDRTCTTGQSANINNNCQCQCDRTCSFGQSANINNNCQCQCDRTCPFGQTPNINKNCICECTNTCSNGQLALVSNNCLCTSPNTCPFGQTPNINGQCQCERTCPFGQSTNINNNCQCQCDRTCPFGQSANINNNCQCQCDRTCPFGQTPNINNNCQCQCDRTCSFGQSANINNNCQCQCDRTCPSGQTPNINNCICECQNTCSNGQRASVTNNCVCSPAVCSNTCPIGRTPNINNNCICECTNFCSNGQLALVSNNCLCISPNTCPFGQTPNINGQCQCDRTCPFGQFANINNNCQCQCDRTCSFGQTPNANNNCICECPNTCSNGQRASVTNNCVCSPPVCSNTCPTGQTPNINNNCQCQCDRTCPSGQSANINNNNCICSCPNTCPPDQLPNPNNNCICQRDQVCNLQCPVPQTPDVACSNCVCPSSCPTNARRLGVCDCQCNDPSLVYVSRTNTCEQTIPTCPRSCPSGTFQNFDCSCSCPQGTSYNQTTSRCDAVVPYDQCTRAEYSCENNQVAYKDCNGRCFCACGSGFAGIRCEIKVQAELCDNCFYDNGHYHAGVVGYCDLFVNCLPVGEVPKDSQTRPASFSPIIMSCAPGTFYITRPNGWRGCDFLENGICSTDQCQTLPANARYADSTSCQSYWQCGANRQLVSKGCCDAGQGFDPRSQSCIPNASCQVTCGPQVARSCNNSTAQPAGCPFEVTANDPNEFFYKEVPWAKSRCLPTDVMDLNLCRCVAGPNSRPLACDPVINYNFDTTSTSDEDRIPRIQISGVGQVANFSGSEDLTLKYFAGSGFYTDYFQINLRLFLPRPPTGSGRIAVVTNADCDVKESVSITMDNRNFYFKIFQLDSNVPVEIVIPYSGLADRNGWYDLTLIYKRINKKTFEFTGKVGSNTQTYQGTVPLTANIDTRTCALHLGYGFNYTSLVGYVDDFQVWRCDPNTGVIG